MTTVWPTSVDEQPRGLRSIEVSTPLICAAILILAVALGVGVSVSAMLGVGVLVIALGTVAVAVRPWLGVVVLVGIVPVVSGLRRGFPIPGFRISELLIAGVSIMLLVIARRGARWTTFDWAAVTYAAASFVVGVIDAVAGKSPLSSGALETVGGPIQFVLLYRAVRVSVRTDANRERCMWLLLGFSVPVSLLALAQTASSGFSTALGRFTDTTNDFGVSAAQTAGRATGPFGHWQTLAGYLLTILILGQAMLVSERPPARRPLIVAILLLDGAGLAVTVSLGPIIAAVVSLCVLGLWARKGLPTIAMIVVGCAIVGVAFGPLLSHRVQTQLAGNVTDTYPPWVPQTLGYRYTLWTTVNIPSLSGHWLLGYGGGLPASFANFPFTESLYFSLLIRGGLILLAAYALLNIVWIAGALRVARSPPGPVATIGRALSVAMIAFLPLNMIESYFLGSGTPHVLWALAGLVGPAWALRARNALGN
jgi:hypothetical protein